MRPDADEGERAAFQEGKDAASNKLGPRVCPYDAGSPRFEAWQEGYRSVDPSAGSER